MKLLAVVCLVFAILIFLGNLRLAFTRIRTGKGRSPLPLLATLLAAAALVLLRRAWWVVPAALALAVLDLGAWSLAARMSRTDLPSGAGRGKT